MAKNKAFLENENFPPVAKKHFGQNFLTSASHASRIVELASLNRSDTVVEIGPGKGAITKKLADKGCRVFALEIDRDLFHYLSNELAAIENLTILNADALTFDFSGLAQKSEGKLKIVANLPYNVSTQILFRLLDQRRRIEKMVLMFQKEVADRITASPGGKQYGALSIFPQLYADITQALKLPPGAFHPVPKVRSTVLVFDILENPRFAVKNKAMLKRVVSAAFSQRRKKLSNSIKSLFEEEGTLRRVFDMAGIDGARRIETLSIKEMCALGNAVYEISCEKCLAP